MRVSCVVNATELHPAFHPDLILFPEGIGKEDVEQARQSYPAAIVAGAVTENGRNRGLLIHQGRNRIDYLKIGADGRTTGGAEPAELPVYETDNVCVGMIICMDIDVRFGTFTRAVIHRIRSSEARWQLLCVPADMAAHWFDPDRVSRTFAGLHLVVCNQVKTHQERCKSFVADADGFKVTRQVATEPLHVDLNATSTG